MFAVDSTDTQGLCCLVLPHILIVLSFNLSMTFMVIIIAMAIVAASCT